MTATAASSTAPSDGSSQRDPKWWTLAAVCLGVFMLLLDITIVNVALPDIQSQLHANLSDLQWVIDAYALSLAALLLTAGSLADLFGRKRIFVIGLVIFTVGSTLCGAAQNIDVLRYSRAFQGIGGAAMFATALALLASAFHGKDRGVAFGAFGATTGVAVAIGPVLGGLLTSGLSWRWIFFVNIPICIVAVALTVLRVQESHDPRAGRPDLFGFVTFSLGLGALVYGLIEAGRTSWGNERVVWSFIAAAALLVIFVISQIVQKDPMFDLGLLRKPTFTGGLIAAFGVSASIFSLLTYLVIYVQNVLGYSAIGTGLRFLFLSAASFIAATVAGRLTAHVPTKWLIAPGFLILFVGLVLLRGIHADSSWTHLIPGLTVSGLGIGMINTPLASTAVGVVETARSGMASGINSTLRQIGVATGIATLGSIFAQRITDSARPELQGKVPAKSLDGLTSALSGGQVRAAAEAAQKAAGPHGKQAYDLIDRVGTQSVVEALNHIIDIAAVGTFVIAILSFVLIRQKDFVAQGPQGGAPEAQPAAGDARGESRASEQDPDRRDLMAHGSHEASTHEAPAGGSHAADVDHPADGGDPDHPGGEHAAGGHAG